MPVLKNSYSVPKRDVRINDKFWSKKIELIRQISIPYQWEVLNDRIPDIEPSYAVYNFRLAAGLEQGEFKGLPYTDTDLGKWIEAVGYSLLNYPDLELEKIADEVIDVICKAQQADGYLNTFFVIKEPDNKWTNLRSHELYCAGHMIEAAVAYYEGTGKRKLLDAVCRFADLIESKFGPEPEKFKGYSGHEEIELALVRLYEATGNERYLKLSKYFIDERGKMAKSGEQSLKYAYWGWGDSKPSISKHEDKAEGHAVRAVYLYSAMADIAAYYNDEKLFEACRRLWDNIVGKQMYITGGIGSTPINEAFTFDYDLPNGISYSETCASIGLIFFTYRMLQMETRSCYADVIERALYNIIPASMAFDGRHFFYVNPLEVWTEASDKNPLKKHIKPVRQPWFQCACCPPNLSRLISSLQNYIYTINENTVYTHLYIGNTADINVGESKLTIKQTTNYPADGQVTIEVSGSDKNEITVAFRIPEWCSSFDLSINSEKNNGENIKDGYILIKKIWNNGDTIKINMDMPAVFIQANPKVRDDAGKVAIQRGPVVYCLEEVDNGGNISAVSLNTEAGLTVETENDITGTGNYHAIKGKATRTVQDDFGDKLYKVLDKREKVFDIKAIPYFMWCNREPGEMAVWIRRN